MGSLSLTKPREGSAKASASAFAEYWTALRGEEPSAHEVADKNRFRWLRHPLRLLAMGMAAFALSFGLTGTGGVTFAVLGALSAVVVGEVLGRSRMRLGSIVGALGLCWLLLWLCSRLLTGTELLSAAIGPHRALSFSVVVRFWVFFFFPVAALRATACRLRAFVAVELCAVIAALALLFAAHRHGVISRPLWLSDWAWDLALDPADVLLTIGAGAVVVLTVLLVAETGRRVSLMSALALPGLAALVLFFFDLSGLPKPDAQNSLGLTGAASGEPPKPHQGSEDPHGGGQRQDPADGGGQQGQGQDAGDAGQQGQGRDAGADGGGQSQGQDAGDGGQGQGRDGGADGGGQSQGRDGGADGGGQSRGQRDGGGQSQGQDGGSESQPPDQPPRVDDDSQQSQQSKRAPMAIVLLGDDYSPPAQMYYFRQEVWSRYNGSRLVAADRADVDADGLSEFPTRTEKIVEPPPAKGRKLVHATVAMVVEHTRPFALESPIELAPMSNPNPERFHRAYRFVSRSQTIPYKELVGLKAGNPKWSQEVRAHYLEPSKDPRFAKLAQEIVAKLPADKRQDPFLAALAVKLWMDQNLTYSTKHRHAGVPDPTADFLFGNRIGYCVHFAHAAVYMWRSLGLPARAATGYAAAEDHRQGSAIMITGGDAHAWPELYLAGVGWIILDISAHKNLDPPAVPPDKEEQQRLAEEARGNPPEGVEEPAEGYDLSRKLPLPPLWQILLVLSGAVLVVLYVIKIARRLAPLLATASGIPSVGFVYASDLLAENGLSRDWGETRESFARRVAEKLPSFAQLTHYNIAARFGNPAVDIAQRPEHSKKNWKQGLKALRAELRRYNKTWRRVLGVLNPASFFASR